MPKSEPLSEVPLLKLRKQHKTLGTLLGVMIGFGCIYVVVGGYFFLNANSDRNTIVLVAPLMALVTTTLPVVGRRKALGAEMERRESGQDAR